jgi:hypothetical protein
MNRFVYLQSSSYSKNYFLIVKIPNKKKYFPPVQFEQLLLGTTLSFSIRTLSFMRG